METTRSIDASFISAGEIAYLRHAAIGHTWTSIELECRIVLQSQGK